MKLSQILGQPEMDLTNFTEIEKRDLAMKDIDGLIAYKKELDKKEFEEQFGNGIKLNLGCGNRKKEGFTNIDLRESVNPDIVWDLENGLPKSIRENSVTGVYAFHILEHIRNLIPLMEDIYRVCKNKAKVYISAPYFKATLAFSDPTHVRFFTEHTFEYFSQQHREKNLEKFDYNIKCDFNILDTVIDDNGIMAVTMEVIKCQKKKKKN